MIYGKNKQILNHLNEKTIIPANGQKNITHIPRMLGWRHPKNKQIIFRIKFSLYICIIASESSSVGRAQPCQGWGREFESRLSLSCLGGGTGRHAGLKILFPLRECGFDSRPRYGKKAHRKMGFLYKKMIVLSPFKESCSKIFRSP